MSDAWDDVMRKVEEDFAREKMALKANKGPVRITGMRTSFPIQEVRRWPLDTVTLQMRADKTRYRWVVSPWVDQGDPEAAVTLQVWREIEGLHRHVSTVGELHRMALRWKGQLVEIPVISIYGEDSERAKHPSVLQVGREEGHTGVTASEVAVDQMRVLGNHPVEGISLMMRFLYYTLGARSVIKDMTLEKFVETYSAEEVRALYCTISGGSSWARPSLREAKLHHNNFKLIQTTPPPAPTDEETDDGDDDDDKRGDDDDTYDAYDAYDDSDEEDEDEDDDEFDEENNEDEDDESPRPSKRRRLNRLDVNGDGKLSEKLKKRLQPVVDLQRLNYRFEDSDTRGNVENQAAASGHLSDTSDAQSYTPPQRSQRLEDILVRQPQAKRMAAAWDWSKIEPQFYKVAIPLAQKMGVKTLPPPLNLSSVSSASSANDGEKPNESLSSSSSVLSPRAELSGNPDTTDSSGEKQMSGEKKDITIDLTGSSNDSLVLSPFLVKAGGKITTVSTSSEESGEPSKKKTASESHNDSVIVDRDDHKATKEKRDG